MRFQPASVTSLTATVVGLVCTLNWINGDGSSGCQIERTIPVATADKNTVTNYVTLALVTAGVTQYVDPTIQFGSAYVYRVTTLPEADAPMYTPAKPVSVSATTTGAQPHLDTTRPVPAGTGAQFSRKWFVILDGASANPQAHSAPDSNPQVVDPSVNGIVYRP